jgi:hypothetical protein
MSRCISIIALFTFWVSVCFSQSIEKTDSLLLSLENASDYEIVDTYLSISLNYKSSNLDSALIFASKAYFTLSNIEYNKGDADYLYTMAMIYKQRSYFSESLEYFQKSLAIYKEINNIQGVCDVYTGIGDIYEYQQSDSLSLTYYNYALDLAINNNLTATEASNYNNIAAIIKDTAPDLAVEYFNKAIDLYSSIEDKASISTCYNNLGILYSTLGEFKKTEDFFLKSYEIKLETNNLQGQAITLNNLAYLSLLISENETSESTKIEYLNKSVDYALQSLEISETTKSLYTIKNSYGTLTQAFYDLNFLVEAMEYQTLFMQVKDSLFNIEKQKNIDELETRYQVNENKFKIRQLEDEKELNAIKTFTIISIIAALLIISTLIIVLLYIRRRKDKTIFKQKEALLTKEKELAEIEIRRKKKKEQILTQELEFKSRQLNSHALNMVQRNKFLIDLKKDIELTSDSLGAEDRRKMRSLLNKLNITLNNEKDWEKFRLYFEQINQDFYNKLKEVNPDLSINDKRICALIKLELSSSEIAQVLNIAPNSIKSARYRLKKRLNLSAEDDLELFIKEL